MKNRISKLMAISSLFLVSFLATAQSTDTASGISAKEFLGVGYYDANKLAKEVFNGDSMSNAVKERFESVVKPTYAISGSHVIFADVVWVSKKLNMTQQIIDRLNNSSRLSAFEFYKPEKPVAYTKVATVDIRLLLRSLNIENPTSEEGKKEFKDKIALANEVIKKIARLSDLDIITQDQANSSSDVDITAAVIRSLTGQPVQAVKVEPVAFIKIGYLDAGRIFKEDSMAKIAGKKLESEFSQRDRDLQTLANQLKAGSGDASEFRVKQRKFREDLNKRQIEENAAVIESINNRIKNFAESENYDLIFRDLVWVKPKYDITDKILVK